ncbi:class I SAM-dependent methyltransferase [Solemya velum gill symbiont]|uniref:class I SAM-dependent methyltransferase n=1 Tax=Solemya velum gill symbiont TaxID=2340 RepID=UPI0009986D9E|nr:class I SAM-dependent methyltransferase [Solemya velum gill symbiont]OOZ44788.1 hypothetical protein BOW37_05775 [Solemya velum gill symbiont]OOZ45782.1 hypothetical protein BOW38_08885 [Solemya velum gill symbiont]OOZ50616.1 hypothetical protein BOW39_02355 [Solemya velum gill symbiont]OOZ51861.1 hypothetical protein BOW40_05830 [Solemya velum gill symbiont]OOZ54404.1 hypothetical protein BOW41_06540 [Solemya velum gill symbiont]
MIHQISSYECYKKSPYKSVKHNTYFAVYDRIFKRYIDKPIVFVEIGVLNGGSLFMWREFFGDKARIIGIDLNPIAKKWEEDGFEIFIGNQSDEKFWECFFDQVGPIDVLLDDGGHTYDQQIVTVESVLPYINDSGLVVIEDTHTSYLKEFGALSHFSFIEYSKNIIDGINYRFGRFYENKSEETIYCVTYFESFVVFEIDRSLSVISSERTDNGGLSVNALDYRYSENSVSIMNRIPSRLKSLKLYVFFQKKYHSLRLYFILKNNIAKAKKMNRYFKY